MTAVLLRFLVWVALCTGVYYAAKGYGWSPWLMPAFAFGSIGLYLWLANRSTSLNDKSSK